MWLVWSGSGSLICCWFGVTDSGSLVCWSDSGSLVCWSDSGSLVCWSDSGSLVCGWFGVVVGV